MNLVATLQNKIHSRTEAEARAKKKMNKIKLPATHEYIPGG